VTSPNLERLALSGELKAERFTRQEFDGLLRLARDRLSDARRPDLSMESRFDLAYNASHALATAALRVHGYRSANRCLAFQCLQHTAGLDPVRCRLFALCHDRRNRAEYQGSFDIGDALLESLVQAATELQDVVARMRPPEVPSTT
jgi:hypothetical protein